MKKRKNKFGLKGLVLAGGVLLGTLIPSLAKSQTLDPEFYKDPSFRASMLPYCRPNIHLTEGKDSLDYHHSGDANEDNKLDENDSQSIRNGFFSDSLKADYFPDLNVNENDAAGIDSVLNGQKENRWEHMNRSERINLLRQVLTTDSANYPPEGIPWNCTNYIMAHQKRFFGIENEENSPVSDDELYGENAIKNIPLYAVGVVTSSGVNHFLAGVLVGPESGDRLSEDPTNFSHWYFWNPSGPNELDEVKPGDANFALNSPADIIWYGKKLNGSFSSTRLIDFDVVDGVAHYSSSYPYLIKFNPASDQEELIFENVPEDVLLNYQPNIDLSQYVEEMPDTAYAKSNLPTSLEKIVSEDIPLNSEYPNHHYKKQITYKASTGYKDSIVIREIEVKDIENPKINNFPEDNSKQYSTDLNPDQINTEDLETQDNSGLEVTLEKSTESTQVMNGTINQVNFDFYTDIIIRDKFDNDTTYMHKTEVRDTEGPEAYLRDNYIRRETGQIAEDAVKSLVEEVYDNSELPVDTIIEQTGDKYYDVTLKDIAGNETYLGNVEVDNPVGTGDDDFLNSELIVYPNPAFQMLFIESEIKYSSIRLLNIEGKVINEIEFKTNLDISNLPKGFYIIEFHNNKAVQRKKIIIK